MWSSQSHGITVAYLDTQQFQMLRSRLGDNMFHIRKAPFVHFLPKAGEYYACMYVQGSTQERTLKFQGGITSQNALINIECALFPHARPQL